MELWRPQPGARLGAEVRDDQGALGRVTLQSRQPDVDEPRRSRGPGRESSGWSSDRAPSLHAASDA